MKKNHFRSRHLILFAKAPRLGRVKTRLAKDIGVLSARRFYCQETASCLQRLQPGKQRGGQGAGGRWKGALFLASPHPKRLRNVWPLSSRWAIKRQKGQDLGERMVRALAGAPPGPVVLVGTDIPTMDVTHIQRAFAALEQGASWVFGPAKDGGFWLIGARRVTGKGRYRSLSPRLFRSLPWSTEQVLALTTDRLQQKGEKIMLLTCLADIDDGKDFERFRTTLTRPSGDATFSKAF